jgi:hypothetical protein
LSANSSKPIHDEVDTILMNNLLALKRHHVRHQNETGASNDGFGQLESTPAPTDTDADGLPDSWEQATGSDPKRANHKDLVPGEAFVPVSYTRLDDYLHFLATPHGIIAPTANNQTAPLEIDLRRYTRGFVSQPQYEVSRATGGKVTAAAHVARFTPTPGFRGRAGFQFTVRDADGSAWTQNFLLLVQ